MGDESQSQVYSYTQLLTLLPSFICAIVFIFLLLVDVWEALRGRVLWIRGRWLILSALTIQLLSVIDNSSVNYGDYRQIEEQVADLLERDQLLIDSRRLMMCVFIGYLFPSILRLGDNWGDIGALALSVTLHMASELYFVWKYINPKESFLWFTVYCTTLFISITLLVALLFCSCLAWAAIKKAMHARIKLALSCCSKSNNSEDEKGKCKSNENHVLKCWIVARACHPDFIMTRSVFSAFVGFIVTVCVVIFAVKLGYVHTLNNYGILNNYVRKATLFILIVFVLVGWIVILSRWLRAVIYFPRVGFYLDESLIKYFEDLWIKELVMQKDNINAMIKGRLFREQIIRERKRGKYVLFRKYIQPVKLQLLETTGLCMQRFMVSLSKVCWSLSQIAVGLSRRLLMSPGKEYMLSSGLNTTLDSDHEFLKYRGVLEIMRMPGETAYSLWITNESGFKQLQKHMKNGYDEGKCKFDKLINLMKHRDRKTGPVEEKAATSPEQAKDDAAPFPLAEYFKIFGKSSGRKMKAVSLIHFMLYYYDGTDTKCDQVNDAIEAYTQAWEYMEMVDSSDDEVTPIMPPAADRDFVTLENFWKRYLEMKGKGNEGPIKLLENKIKSPLMKDVHKFSDEEKTFDTSSHKNPFLDSLDWMTITARFSKYKTWKEINQKSATSIDKLQRLLANEIFDCITNEFDKAVKVSCYKSALEFDDEKIFNAAFMAEQAKGVLHEIEIREGKDAAQDEGQKVGGNRVKGEGKDAAHDEGQKVEGNTLKGEGKDAAHDEGQKVEGNRVNGEGKDAADEEIHVITSND